MQVQIDTREHKAERERIEKQFDAIGVDYFRSKLYVGDYMNMDNPRLCIDRKKDLQELCGNVCQQHERFREELVRANKAGIKLIILCEHGEGIETLSDVYFWHNPRIDDWEKNLRLKHWGKHRLPLLELIEILKAEGVPAKDLMPPIDGSILYKSLETIKKKYDVDILFCEKCNTGYEIFKLLGGGDNGKR